MSGQDYSYMDHKMTAVTFLEEENETLQKGAKCLYMLSKFLLLKFLKPKFLEPKL